MTERFVLDESSWAEATEANLVGELANAIECLLERLDVARGRDEPVVKYKYFYDTDLGDGVRLYASLFDPCCPLRLDRDLTNRLIIALDRAKAFDDSRLHQEIAEFHGDVWLAPGVVWAHTSCLEGRYVAVLPLPIQDVPVGQVPVTVDDATLKIVFVKEESQHVAFFRSLISLEDADETQFKRLAPSAFPALDWADDVWSGLGDFSCPYIEIRDKLVKCLGGLSDHGAACFDTLHAGDPRHLTRVLSARIGAQTSDENGATKRFNRSRQERSRRHRGINKVFWWHIKLQPHVDRIHFLYEPSPGRRPRPRESRIVVGLFKDHCILPN